MNKIISGVYLLAGFTNILGICIASRMFSNPVFFQQSPQVFSYFGSFMLLIWGIAYIAAAGRAATMGPLALVFAFQKGVYAYTWVLWMSNRWDSIDVLLRQSKAVGIFYSSYGLTSLFFGLFFLWVGLRAMLNEGTPAAA